MRTDDLIEIAFAEAMSRRLTPLDLLINGVSVRTNPYARASQLRRPLTLPVVVVVDDPAGPPAPPRAPPPTHNAWSAPPAPQSTQPASRRQRHRHVQVVRSMRTENRFRPYARPSPTPTYRTDTNTNTRDQHPSVENRTDRSSAEHWRQRIRDRHHH
ncbi:unnamed protein product [Vitrella brassicaformis CCMP3155]|uniref:Uncharacterized protein n=1 Tax=Vitrella brassicaformis (strain CCMP3155) TaxID=1169540 RepID=A0A0G4FMJ9_VITBC|nr:unnamed protein product [Vitrella brassicaformis CCMP3155]|eukprot:CEM14796.1 unnamed protein product [Vitrella brassicaformis CCMP3155]